ncbi:uncharacterized protein ACA1_249890 [Acanthamoeba castellanii str. Neff]|uniref:Uncharacterized protein n=1 Tax=Acanthamoeba castellanii (strain ATCC 30010 / Neff) TaxID=1257118 RepID=L8HD86_ACACF|nr:uncharacterized protein ACA1_249890 [Acanthamoeba castellanii str. Neff]ELR23125.1 hypothetical protein ACA1_249890 [Acanthamoeba castellanii str. Neff]
MGCIWLIAERSELLKQYLCKLLETVKAWTVLETEPQGREESLMCVILCHCPALTDVTLRNNPRFTGESACKWLKDHKTPLHALDLSGCDQLSDALLDLLPTSVHAKSLQSLCLDGAVLLSKAALVACFTPAEDEPDRWQALGQLHLAGIPAVDPEVGCKPRQCVPFVPQGARLVIETVCRSCVALRDFSFLETSADDSALAHIPTDMRKGLGVPYNEIFHLANALPSLEEFQTTTGSTFLFTGNSPAVIRFSPQANLFQREHTDGKREILYHVHHGAAAFLRGETSTFHLRNANLHKSIADTVHTLTQATFNPHSQPGNLIRPLVPGVTHLTALFYNSSMRKVESRPPHIISINGGYMNITAFTEHVFNVAPRQNLTVVLALYFQLVLAK